MSNAPHDELDADALAMLRAFRADERIPAEVHDRVWSRVQADVTETSATPTAWFRRGAVLGVLVAAAVAALWMGRQALDASRVREPASQAGYEQRAATPRGASEPHAPAPAMPRDHQAKASPTIDPVEPTAATEPSTTDGTPSPPLERRGSTSAERKAIATEPAPQPVPGDTLAAENRLLSQVRDALVDEQPQRALTLLAEHARRFPQGVFAEERQALHAVALCDVGRDLEGPAAARVFLREHPRAALAQRVRGACLE